MTRRLYARGGDNGHEPGQRRRYRLLSPACASMDMFSNYMQRGFAFEEAVQEVALEHGEV